MLLVIRVSHCGEKDRWDEFRKQNFKNAKQIIVCGIEDQKENYILEDDVLYLKCRDKWEDLPEKMIAAFCAILDIPELNKYTTFLKADSDLVPKPGFDPSHICKLGDKRNYVGARLRKPARHQHGVYHLKKNLTKRSPWKGKKYSNAEFLSVTFALGGIGYMITRHAMKKIIMKYNFSNLGKVKHEFIYEDVMVGIILKRHNIRPIQAPLNVKDTRKSVKTGNNNRRRRLASKNGQSPNKVMALVRAGLVDTKYSRRRRRNGSVSRQKT